MTFVPLGGSEFDHRRGIYAEFRKECWPLYPASGYTCKATLLTSEALGSGSDSPSPMNLVHTFFYNVSDGAPRPTSGWPKGKRLEYLCHAGAPRILVPDALPRREVKQRGGVPIWI